MGGSDTSSEPGGQYGSSPSRVTSVPRLSRNVSRPRPTRKLSGAVSSGTAKDRLDEIEVPSRRIRSAKASDDQPEGSDAQM